MKKYLHLLIIGVTVAATAFAVGSQPSAAAAESCDAGACCTPCCSK